MKICQVALRTWAIAASVLAGISANAQETLPPDVYVAAPPLTPEQQQAIDGYVDFWSAKLCAGDVTDVSEARNKLKDPLSRPGSGEEFSKRYSASLITSLSKCVGSEMIIVRLNLMHVVTFVKYGASPFELIEACLSDDSPGVRYWAAKAVANLAGREDLKLKQQKQILELLVTALGQEDDAIVLAELLKALNALPLPAARDALLGVLTDRAVVYKEDELAMFEPVRVPLQELYIDLIRRFHEEEQVDNQIAQLARVAFLYLSLAAHQLDQIPELSSERQLDKDRMIKQCDEILRYVLDQIATGTRPPEPINNARRTHDWKFVLAQVERWKTILMRPPFNFNEEDLTISDAARAAEAAQ